MFLKQWEEKQVLEKPYQLWYQTRISNKYTTTTYRSISNTYVHSKEQQRWGKGEFSFQRLVDEAVCHWWTVKAEKAVVFLWDDPIPKRPCPDHCWGKLNSLTQNTEKSSAWSRKKMLNGLYSRTGACLTPLFSVSLDVPLLTQWSKWKKQKYWKKKKPWEKAQHNLFNTMWVTLSVYSADIATQFCIPIFDIICISCISGGFPSPLVLTLVTIPH